MNGKIILDAPLIGVRSLTSLSAGDPLASVAAFSVGAVEAAPGYQFRVRLELEPIDVRPPEERALDAARERMRSNIVRLWGYQGAELDDLAEAIEDLASARIEFTLSVHRDADHDD